MIRLLGSITKHTADASLGIEAGGQLAAEGYLLFLFEACVYTLLKRHANYCAYFPWCPLAHYQEYHAARCRTFAIRIPAHIPSIQLIEVIMWVEYGDYLAIRCEQLNQGDMRDLLWETTAKIDW